MSILGNPSGTIPPDQKMRNRENEGSTKAEDKAMSRENNNAGSLTDFVNQNFGAGRSDYAPPIREFEGVIALQQGVQSSDYVEGGKK